MGKLKATARGKAGKHRSQDTLKLVKARAVRICRVRNATDGCLMAMLHLGNQLDEPTGRMAGRCMVTKSHPDDGTIVGLLVNL